MTADAAESDSETERYGTFETGDGERILYDRNNPDAWIQSDHTVTVGDRGADVGPETDE